MKTRVLSLGQACLPIVFCLSLTSCNKDDYYEKEFLDNPFQQSATTGIVDGGAQEGTDYGNGSTTQGGVDDGGVNGGADGSATSDSSTTTGGTLGGTVGGTTGDSSSAGAISGGSSTGGSSTGGSSTGGSSTGGSSTGGSSTGGVTTGGSTTEGSTTGGSTVGGTTGGIVECGNNGHGNNEDGVDVSNPGNSKPIDPSGTIDDEIHLSSICLKKEEFRQTAEQTKKLDIVWVIDNSGSMADEQDALGSNFNAFIQDFMTKNVDFKMAITTTDTTGDNRGAIVPGNDTKLNSAAAALNPQTFLDDFRDLVRVGTHGSGFEKGLEAAEGFMQKFALSFLRPDAYLAVVILSDEEDQSAKTPTEYTDFLKSFKNEAGLIKVYSIVDSGLTNTGSSGISTGFQRYADASEATAGLVGNIRDDFYQILSTMGESIINLLDSFALEDDPISGTLVVKVNGVETTNYTFDPVSRSIKFNQGSIPPVNAQIEVSYHR